MKCYHWFLLLCCLPTWLSANEILDNFLQGLHTLQAQFEQDLLNEKGDLVEKSQGKMFIQRPNQFNWEYKKPYTQLIVADGKNIWLYDESLEQVTVKPQSDQASNSPLMILTDVSQLDKQFKVTELGEFEGMGLLELRSLDSESEFERILLGLDSRGIRMMAMEDAFGLRTEIQFENVLINQPADAELFQFTPPEGTDVVGVAALPE